MHVQVKHIRKLYNDYTGRFPILSRSGNQYIIIPYRCDYNAIIAAPFKSRAKKHRLLACSTIMQWLKDRNMLVDFHILDNKASAEYNIIIKAEWGVEYQLVLPHIHRINASEREIFTFKAHFLSILSGIAKTSPKNLWGLIIPQTELTPNLLRQSTLNPKISAWEYFQVPFEYKVNPFGPLGCLFMIHRKTSNTKSWYFKGKEGWSIDVALYNYRCQSIIPHNTKAYQISDKLDFRHQTITTPVMTPEDRILHGLTTLTDSLTNLPTAQLDAPF